MMNLSMDIRFQNPIQTHKSAQDPVSTLTSDQEVDQVEQKSTNLNSWIGPSSDCQNELQALRRVKEAKNGKLEPVFEEEKGVETFKCSETGEDQEAFPSTDPRTYNGRFDLALYKQGSKRKKEIKTMNDQSIEAKELLTQVENLGDLESLVNKNFGLESLNAEDQFATETKAESSQAEGFRTSLPLNKNEMRLLSNQQRQAYIRRSLRSQSSAFTLQRYKNLNRQERDDSFSQVNFEKKSGLVLGNKTIEVQSINQNLKVAQPTNQQGHFQKIRCQTRGDPASTVEMNPSIGIFHKESNATNQFFNQRLEKRAKSTINGSRTMNILDDSRSDCYLESNHPAKKDQDASVIIKQKSVKKRKKKDAILSRQNQNKKDNFDTTQQSSFGTYPNVPLQIHKRKNAKIYGSTGNDDFQKALQEGRTQSKLSYENTHFKDKPKTAALENKRKIQKASLTQKNSAVEGLLTEAVSAETNFPLNRFNANHQVKVKPLSIYDSIKKTQLSFPSGLDPNLSQLSSILGDYVIPMTAKKDASTNGNEAAIVRQIEKDLKRLMEQHLQDQIDRENNYADMPVDAKDEQARNDKDQAMGIKDLQKLAGCFWRFPQAERIINDVVKMLESVSERKRRQLALYVRQVQGQFDLIADDIAKREEISRNLVDHLRREEEFRQKVLNRENYEVLKLIEEFEMMPTVGKEKMLQHLEYSDLTKEIEQIRTQLEGGQLTREIHTLFAEKETPASLNIINEVKEETTKRTRTVQVNTAKRVLQRFYKKQALQDKEMQTDADEISMAINNAKSILDSMMERDFEQQEKLEFQKGLNAKLQKRIEFLELTTSDQKELIEKRESQIELQKIQEKILIEQLKTKERELIKLEVDLKESETKLAKESKLSFQLIQDLQVLKPKLKELEKQKIVLEESIDTLKIQLNDILAEESTSSSPIMTYVGEEKPHNEEDPNKIKLLERKITMKDSYIKKLERQLSERHQYHAQQPAGINPKQLVPKKELLAEEEDDSPRNLKIASQRTGVPDQNEKGRNLRFDLSETQAIERKLVVGRTKVSQTVASHENLNNKIATISESYGIESRQGSAKVLGRSDTKSGNSSQSRKSLIGIELESATIKKAVVTVNKEVSHANKKAKVQIQETGKVLKILETYQIDKAKNVKEAVCKITDDNRCSGCAAKLDIPMTIYDSKPFSMISKIDAMLIGRHSSVFSQLLKKVERKVEQFEQIYKERLQAPSSNSVSPVRVSQQIKFGAHGVQSSDLKELREDDSQVSGLSGIMQPRIYQSRSLLHDPSQPYTNAIQNSQREQQSWRQTINKSDSRGNPKHTMSRVSQAYNQQPDVAKNARAVQDLSADLRASQASDERFGSGINHSLESSLKLVNDLSKDIGRNVNYRFALDSKTEKLQDQKINQKFQKSSRHASMSFKDNPQSRQNKSRKEPLSANENLPGKFRIIKAEISTQTQYEPEDALYEFLRKIDDALAMKGYRGVSPLGQPKLSGASHRTHALKVIQHQQSHSTPYRFSPSKVGNVANVAKMRKFEPLRKRRGFKNPSSRFDDAENDTNNQVEMWLKKPDQQIEDFNHEMFNRPGTVKILSRPLTVLDQEANPNDYEDKHGSPTTITFEKHSSQRIDEGDQQDYSEDLDDRNSKRHQSD